MARYLTLLVAALAMAAPPEQARVDGALARAVVWLRGEQDARGGYGANPGECALALLALRHAGVPADDPACARAAAHLRRELPDGTVYGAALGVLALLAHSPEAHRDRVRLLLDHLAKGQCENGQWTYAYRATARKKAGDNSNTQLAILACAAARARRFDVDDEVFRRCQAFFRASQNSDGGFGYGDNQRKRSYGSMTAGGAMALALGGCVEAQVAFRDAGGLGGADLRRALAWLGEGERIDENRGSADAFGGRKGRRGDSFWKHYWLWSLERACHAAAAPALGGRDWYADGAAYLLGAQRAEGSWRDPERELQATCFAVLFLTRSTLVTLTPRDRDRTAVTGR